MPNDKPELKPCDKKESFEVTIVHQETTIVAQKISNAETDIVCHLKKILVDGDEIWPNQSPADCVKLGEVENIIMENIVKCEDTSDAALMHDVQEINGEWYAMKWGCDTLEKIIDDINNLSHLSKEG